MILTLENTTVDTDDEEDVNKAFAIRGMIPTGTHEEKVDLLNKIKERE